MTDSRRSKMWRFAPSLPDDELHVIRLRGPWQYEPLARTVARGDGTIAERAGRLPASGTTKVPISWAGVLGADFRGRVRFRRRFGRPTGLSEGHQVVLVVEKLCGIARCWLNDQLLGETRGPHASLRVNVSGRLQQRNELRVEIDLPELADDSIGALDQTWELPNEPLLSDVRLEIIDDET